MKKLKMTFIVMLAVTLLTSCSQFIQLVESESVGKDAVSKEGVCENADLKLNYDFWSEDGVTYFSIYNKADKPIYIDWKRSVFVYNDWKYNYWIEKTTTETYMVPVGSGKNIGYVPKVSTVWAERYTFIPPHCYVSVPMTYTIRNSGLLTVSQTNEKGKTSLTYAQSIQKLPNAKGYKTTIPKSTGTGNAKVWALTYTQENSPDRFRNFLTYSFDEKFTTEKFIENDFYLSKITEMTTKNFFGSSQKVKVSIKIGSKKASGKVRVYDSPYRSNTAFYNTLIQ